MISRAYRALGLLGWLGLLTLIAGALVQHFSSHLPAGYTWRMPFDTLGLVYGKEWLPTSFLAITLVGQLRRPSGALQDDVANVMVPWRAVLLGGALALLDVLFNPQHNPIDAGAVMALGILTARMPMARQRWQKGVGQFVLGAVVFAFVCYFFSVVKALTLVNRVQYDAALADFERAIVGAYPHRLVAMWASTQPDFVKACDWAYFHLFQHMALTTVLLTSMRQRTQRFEYLGALALCYTIGGIAYHVLPAVGPVYFDPDAYAFLNDLPLSANPIRAQLFHYTSDVLASQEDVVHTWGYVAGMPSLHIAHELVMLYYARRSRIAFSISIAFTGITLIAVVVLGWHYFVDELGGLVVAVVAIAIARWQRERLMPAALAPEPDEPLAPRPLREWWAELLSFIPPLPTFDDARAKKLIVAIAGAGLAARLAVGLHGLEATDRLFIPDDAYYTLSLARSFAHGLGPTIQGSALTHGFQPLLVFLSVPVFWITTNLAAPLVWVLFLSILADAASIWLLGGIARRLGGPVAGVIAAALWALSPLALANALDGLETAIAFACQLAFVEAALHSKNAEKGRRFEVIAGVFAGLALLARVDSIFLIAAMAFVLRKRAVTVALVAAAVVAPWAIYAQVRFGSVVPESFALNHAALAIRAATDVPVVKRLGWIGGSILGGSFADLPALRSWLFRVPALGIAILVAMTIAAALAVNKLRSPVVIAFAFHGAAVVVLFAPTLWLSQHYFGPFYGAFALLLALSVARRRLPSALVLCAAASCGVVAIAHSLRDLPDSAESGRGLNAPNGFGATAQEVLALVPNDAVIGAFQSGALGYYAPPTVTVVNLDGAVDGDARRAFAERKLLDYAFARKLTFMAGWRVNIEGLRFASAKSPRGIGATGIGHVHPQGAHTFTVYAVTWPHKDESKEESGPEPGQVRPSERP